jgi:hypothetical protein
MDENGVPATIERDEEIAEVLDFAESFSDELRRNRPLAAGHNAR